MQKSSAATANSGALTAETAKVGKSIWADWLKNERWIALGIREKTAKGTGTRAAMLAVAAYGYEAGKGRVLAMAVRQAMGLEPNVGGIDFPWLEKTVNIRTITPSATVRQDKRDGKMRLLPIEAAKRPASKAKATAKPTLNSEVRVVRESDAKLAARDAAMADIAATLGSEPSAS